MKTSELRIENWVDCNKKRHNEKFIKVESICSECINILFRRYEIDDLLPIPLTEELILKCGFKKGQYEYMLGDFIMEWFHNGYNFTGGEGCQMGVPILYLHQLQNLYFALTGEELIIDL